MFAWNATSSLSFMLGLVPASSQFSKVGGVEIRIQIPELAVTPWNITLSRSAMLGLVAAIIPSGYPHCRRARSLHQAGVLKRDRFVGFRCSDWYPPSSPEHYHRQRVRLSRDGRSFACAISAPPMLGLVPAVNPYGVGPWPPAPVVQVVRLRRDLMV